MSMIQQVKVVKYWTQLVWGTTFSCVYLVMQLLLEGVIGSECTSNATRYGPDPVGQGVCAGEPRPRACFCLPKP